MAVNLSKNGAELMAAYKDVVDSKSDTNWALFTYEGNSNDIRLAEKGGGGLEEMVEELNSGKVMYAFCRVQDPNSGLPKYVLINWTGEGVKDSRKGVYANHVTSMANFLRGAHVTINARAEDDVEPDAILAKVATASGANFKFHQPTPEYRDAPRGPVGSVYRKVNAVEEIQQTNKDDFWVQAQRDEELRRRQESQRMMLEKQTMERERNEMEERQAKERERRAMEEKQRLGSVYRKVNAVEEIQQTNKDDFWVQAQRDEELRRRQESQRMMLEKQTVERERNEMEERQAKERESRANQRAVQLEQERIQQRRREEEEREEEQQRPSQQESEGKRSSILQAASVQKANEAKSLISQRSFNPRDIFKQREQSSAAAARPSPAAPTSGKLQSPFLFQESSERGGPLQPQAPPSPPPSAMAPPSSVSPAVSPTPAETTWRHHAADAAHSDEEAEWSDEFDDDAGAAPTGDISHEAAAQEDLYQEPRPAHQDLHQDLYQEEPVAGDVVNNGQDVCARAVYDYQAADDTEITFDPDDIITGIEMVDEGWWRGYGPDGRYGMFPANYVELV